MLTEIGSAARELLHGWSGLALDFAAVQGPMWVAMARGRAQLRAFLASPVLAGTLTIVTGIGISVAGPLLHAAHVAGGGLMEFAIGGSVGGFLGYRGGRVLTRSSAAAQGYIRGATVLAAEEIATQRSGWPERGRERGTSKASYACRHPDPASRRDQAFQADRYDWRRQEHGDRRAAVGSAEPRRSRRYRRSGRRLHETLLRCAPRRCGPEPL